MKVFAEVNFPTPGPLKSLILAETVLTFYGGHYLNSFASVNFPIPGPLESSILAETVLTFVWRELFEFICKSELPCSRTVGIFDFR